MATTVQTPKQIDGGQTFLLDHVSWEQYEAIGEALAERPGLYMTYDRGRLEFMTTSQLHEWLKTSVGNFITFLCYELDIPVCSGGSFTMKRKDRKRGLEPDECYWIQHESDVRGRFELDWTRDPAPDLAVEIEVTTSSLDRQSIYGALGVVELWRFDENGRLLAVLLLQENGRYKKSNTSKAFPFLPVERLSEFLKFDDPRDETARLRDFVAWLRELDIKR